MGTLFIGSEGVACIKTSLLINTTQLMAMHVFFNHNMKDLFLSRNVDYRFSKYGCEHWIVNVLFIIYLVMRCINK